VSCSHSLSLFGRLVAGDVLPESSSFPIQPSLQSVARKCYALIYVLLAGAGRSTKHAFGEHLLMRPACHVVVEGGACHSFRHTLCPHASQRLWHKLQHWNALRMNVTDRREDWLSTGGSSVSGGSCGISVGRRCGRATGAWRRAGRTCKRSAGGVEAIVPAAQCAGTPATVDQSMEMQEIGWNCTLEGAHSVQLQMVTAQRS